MVEHPTPGLAGRNVHRSAKVAGRQGCICLILYYTEYGARCSVKRQGPWDATIQRMGSPFRLDGRHALVTGGASGIGEQVSRVLTAAGASVAIADMDRARAGALAAELPGASAAIFDVTDEAAVNRRWGGWPGSTSW